MTVAFEGYRRNKIPMETPQRGGKNLRFSTEIAIYLGNGTRQLLCPSSVWPHLFFGAGHEKSRGQQLKWSLAFTLYIGSLPCAQLYQYFFLYFFFSVYSVSHSSVCCVLWVFTLNKMID